MLSIHDDGLGFTPPAHLGVLARDGHFGLVGLAEQVAGLRGRLEVEARLGAGATVTARVPLHGRIDDDA